VFVLFLLLSFLQAERFPQAHSPLFNMSSWTREDLLSTDSTVAEGAWASLCRRPQTLYTLESSDWAQIMHKGLQWDGKAAGYNATSATTVLKQFTGQIVVSQDMAYFRGIFLYAFALAFEMEWGSAFPALNAEQIQVAFHLYEYMDQHPDNVQEDTDLHWDKLKLPLSQQLGLAYKRSENPMSHEVRKELLKPLPIIDGIPEHAPENNFKNDSSREADKVHKAWEKSLLEGLRVLTCLDAKLNDNDEIEGTKKDLMTTAFFLFAELQHRIQDYRRTASVPGSVAKDKENVLFTKDELAVHKLQRSVDTMRSKGGHTSKGGKGQKGHFRASSYSYDSSPTTSSFGNSNPQKCGHGGRKGGGGRGGRGKGKG
jgi:hypothetical protein